MLNPFFVGKQTKLFLESTKEIESFHFRTVKRPPFSLGKTFHKSFLKNSPFVDDRRLRLMKSNDMKIRKEIIEMAVVFGRNLN